jgi:hypothetical protein
MASEKVIRFMPFPDDDHIFYISKRINLGALQHTKCNHIAEYAVTTRKELLGTFHKWTGSVMKWDIPTQKRTWM